MQQTVLKLLGITDEEAQDKFGFLTDAPASVPNKILRELGVKVSLPEKEDYNNKS